MRGSIIFASMYIGGGLGMRFVGLSVGSVAACSGSALNGLCSLISCSHCFFSNVSIFLALASGVTFCFLLEVATVQLSSWYVLLPFGLYCFHNIVFFLYICRVCSFIYEICFSGINYFYWWNLHDSTFCRWAFALSLSLPSCRTFTGALSRTSVRSPTQAELTHSNDSSISS